MCGSPVVYHRESVAQAPSPRPLWPRDPPSRGHEAHFIVAIFPLQSFLWTRFFGSVASLSQASFFVICDYLWDNPFPKLSPYDTIRNSLMTHAYIIAGSGTARDCLTRRRQHGDPERQKCLFLRTKLLSTNTIHTFYKQTRNIGRDVISWCRIEMEIIHFLM